MGKPGADHQPAVPAVASHERHVGVLGSLESRRVNVLGMQIMEPIIITADEKVRSKSMKPKILY
jgi:hypothetical protein